MIVLRCGGHLCVTVSEVRTFGLYGEVGEVGDIGGTSTVARLRGEEGSLGMSNCFGLGRWIRFEVIVVGSSSSTVNPVLFGERGDAMIGEGIVRRFK